MGNSPSRSNISGTTKTSSTTTQQFNGSSDEVNGGDPVEPDDSGTHSKNKQNVKKSNHVESTKNISIRKENLENFNFTGGELNVSNKSPPLRRSSYNLDIDISLAKAFGNTASISTPAATPIKSNTGSNLVVSQSNGSSSNNSSFNSGNTLFTSNVGGQLMTKDGSISSTNSMNPHGSTTINVTSSVSSSAPKNVRMTNNTIFLKKYSHDNEHSTEGLNIDDAIEKLLKIGETKLYSNKDIPFHSWEIQLICFHAREIFLNQPSLLKLQAPIKVVGDVHGQFNDLLRILKLSGVPPETNYLFLGDYVDRGKQSLETILLLLCYKIKYPNNFFMLRGNHESANVTKIYGFYDECKRRKNTKIWKMFVDVFNSLPFAATINEKIFCVHGGISPELSSLKQIASIKRPTDIPEEGLMTDILWSDPDSQVADWSTNDRGVSYVFGKRNVVDFCANFKMDLIIRGHMVVEDGYEFFAKKKLVTVFSAPNYCGEFQNWGAVMSVTTGLMCSFELLKPHTLKHRKLKK